MPLHPPNISVQPSPDTLPTCTPAMQDFESKDMQRRWIAAQTELVALLNDNGTAAENVRVS